ncbi:MAG: CBS domain-containing protein [Elusimicrobia bacterium]|nr:CBS domain-containing protein [Elusimicrobiota bacterium]
MRPLALVLRESDDAWTAAKSLFDGGQAGAPVVDTEGRLTGVLSQSDLAAYLRERSQRAADFYAEPDRDPGQTRPPARVGQLMSRLLVLVPEDMALEEVERHMLRRRVQRVLVTRDGCALGVISALDLLRSR